MEIYNNTTLRFGLTLPFLESQEREREREREREMPERKTGAWSLELGAAVSSDRLLLQSSTCTKYIYVAHTGISQEMDANSEGKKESKNKAHNPPSLPVQSSSVQ